MELHARQTVEILHETALGEAQRTARGAAAAAGFGPGECEEVALVASELATNVARHAREGRLLLALIAEGDRKGLQVEALDRGPGIVNVDEALGDGFSTAGSLGLGLGVVNRLMDELDIRSVRGQGTHVVCRKWVRTATPPAPACPLAVGVATRPHRSFQENGDDFVVHHWGQNLLVGVIDGLGHGQYAHRAARTATQYIKSHFDQPMTEIFRGVGRACRATRGVVMALTHIDWGNGRMVFASVGNIEARTRRLAGSPHRFLVRRGIIGVQAPSPLVEKYDWTETDMLVLHSDGLSTHWKWEDLAGLETLAAPALAQEMLRRLGKADDDATVLVVRSAKP